MHVPDDLVEEGRVEGRVLLVAGRPVRRVDLERPGQVGRLAEELLVEVVAEPPDRLGEQDGRPDGVGEERDVRAPPPRDDRPGDDAERHSAPDAEPALPDREDAPPLVRNLVPARDDVVEARADDPCADAPHGAARRSGPSRRPSGPTAAPESQIAAAMPSSSITP